MSKKENVIYPTPLEISNKFDALVVSTEDEKASTPRKRKAENPPTIQYVVNENNRKEELFTEQERIGYSESLP